MVTNKQPDRILVIEEDPLVLDLIANQVLASAGFAVKAVDSGPAALPAIQSYMPDVIIVSLEMRGFSGKDLLAALRAQGLNLPVIAMAEAAVVNPILDAFRLGARDFLSKPIREAEVISAVDRVMSQVQMQREREQLQTRLQQANKELEVRVKELTTLVGIGKAVVNVNLTDMDTLFSRVVEASLYVTGANMGWLLINDETSNQLVLRAARNAPRAVLARLNQAWNDGVAPLVMLSGEPLRMVGDGLKRFQLGSMAQSALVVPIVVRGKSVGVLVVANTSKAEFSERHQAMLVAVSDYASIGIANMRLFQQLTKRGG